MGHKVEGHLQRSSNFKMTGSSAEIVPVPRDFNCNIRRLIDGFEGIHERYDFGARNVECTLSFATRKTSVANT